MKSESIQLGDNNEMDNNQSKLEAFDKSTKISSKVQYTSDYKLDF